MNENESRETGNGHGDEGQRAAQAQYLWHRASNAARQSTESSLREAIALFESAISLVSFPEMLAALYHDLGVAHRRLAKYGHSDTEVE